MAQSETTKSVKITRVPLANLVSDPKNARIHDNKNHDAIKKSIEKFGAGRSMVIDGNNVVRAGNGTLEAALDAGLSNAIVIDAKPDEMVIVRRKDWTEDQAIAYGLADNKTTDMSTFDNAVVSELIQSLPEELHEFTGFNEEEIKDFLDGSYVNPEDLPPEPKTNKVGEHHHLAFSDEMWIVVNLAIEKMREREGESAMSGSRAIELISAEFYS